MNLILLEEIRVPDNIRSDTEESSIDELIQSIRAVREVSGGEKSLVQPVIVRELSSSEIEDGSAYKYELRYGFRRFCAFKTLWERNARKYPWANKIPAQVDRWVDDEEEHAQVMYQLVENVQRQSMNILDEAVAIERLMKEAKVNQTKVAKMLGKSKGWVTQRLQLLKLDDTVQSEVQDGNIGQSQARELARIKDKEKQREALQEVKEEDDDKASLDTTKKVVRKKIREEKKEGNTTEEESTTPSKEEDTNDEETEESSTPDLLGDVEIDDDINSVADLSHQEKKAYAILRREARQHNRPEPALPGTSSLPAALQDQADTVKTRVEQAREDEDRMRQAFYAGADQALRYALGERKSIRWDKRQFED